MWVCVCVWGGGGGGGPCNWFSGMGYSNTCIEALFALTINSNEKEQTDTGFLTNVFTK